MIRAIIIDDESHSRETTRLMVNALASNDIEIVGVAERADEGIQLIRDLAPDLIFLDIHMPSMSGIEMLDRVPHYQGEIIFITAYNQYAIQAFKKGALHYLLKPIDADELENALNRVYKTLHKQKQNTSGNWLSLSTQEGWSLIRKIDIVRVESYKNYSTIVTKDSSYTVSKTMKNVEAFLPKEKFFRVHNTHIVHINFIDKILKADGGSILLQNGETIPISKTKKKDFFEWFQKQMDNI